MMDHRIVRVGVEIDGVLHQYERLRIKASGTKYSNPTQNDCSVTISNLNSDTRGFLLSAIDQNFKKQAPRITLEVGRESTGYFVVFIGDAIDATVSSPPDVDLTLKCKTNRSANSKIIVKSSAGDEEIKSIAQQCAANSGLRLQFEATPKRISGHSFNGTAAQQIEALQRIGGIDCFIDDTVLVVTNRGAPRSERVRILNMSSGLVGIPKRTPKGAQIQFLIDAETKIGGVLRLESKADKSLSGDYRVSELKFEIETHADAFFFTAEGVRI